MESCRENTRKLWKVMVGSGEKDINLKNWTVSELKQYLQARGISVSTKKREELVKLPEKAHEPTLKLNP